MEHNWSGRAVKELALFEMTLPKTPPTAPHAGGGAPAGIDPLLTVVNVRFVVTGFEIAT